jgi:hypothetical protein
MVENMVDFSRKSTTLFAIFPTSSISKPHGANMAQSCSVTVFFLEKLQCHIHYGATTFSPWWHHFFAMVPQRFKRLKPLACCTAASCHLPQVP